MTRVAAAASAALIAATAAAREGEPIVVTGARTQDKAAASGVAIIDSAEIELLQPASTLDLLDRLAGVRAFDKGGAAGPSYLSIRGGEPNFTLVLLDGVKVTDPTNSRGGAFDFGQIDPLALDRIEVAKGALSAVHGADALSGVVHLRLRTIGPGQSLASARMTGDTEAGHGGTLLAGRGWGSGSLLGGASYADSAGLTEGSDIARGQAFARLTQRLGAFDLSGLALHARADRQLFPEDSGGPRLAVVRERERRETALSLFSLQVAGFAGQTWQPRLALSWSGQSDDSDTPAIAPAVLDGVPAIRADSRFRRAEAVFDNRLDLGAAAQAAFGAAYLHERGASDGTIDFGVLIPADFRIERSIASGFAEATLRPAGRMSATFGLRYDDPSTAAGEWTGRASVRWQPLANGPMLTGSWSEGYKLPSLYALAHPLIANPRLRPERSRNFDVGLEQALARGGGFARIGYFHSRYTDLIDFDAETFTNVNRSRVTAQGLEAELRAPLTPTLAVHGSLTYLDTDQPTGAPPLRSRPEWSGLLALDWRPSDRLRLEASGAYTSAFFDSSVPTGLVTLDGRLRLAAAAQYRLSDAVIVTLTADNLLDENYEEAVGFPAPGRVVRLGLLLRPL
ncbi:MAG TPA: TonB-dependent receptor [Allosphingosinicella sp.]|nr:TonB-dependent receptor [Allosphingosinicella sp.]